VAIEIHIFENGMPESERKPLLDMQTSSAKIAAMNLRALAAELDGSAEQREVSAPPVRERKRRSDAGTSRGTTVSAPVSVHQAAASLSPFAAPAQP
jgi:hypothetical protein